MLPDAHLIHLSSVQVYGETQFGVIYETSPLLGTNSYAQMHKRLEVSLSPGRNSTILRLGNVFGCAGRNGIISWNLVTHDLAKQFAESQHAKVRSNPNQARDFVPAALLVEVVERVVEKKTLGVFNVTTGQSTTLRNWVNFIRDRAEIVLGSPCEISFDGEDQPRAESRFDCRKLDELGPFSSPLASLLTEELDALLEFAKAKAARSDE
jgi:nucleoside-diphosphate-sugar epimerase